MIKKIIFDIDGTLLNTEKDCFDTYLEYYHNSEIAKLLYDIIGKYDSENHSFEKEDLVNYINNNIGFNFTMDDFNKIFEMYNHHATLIDKDIPRILEELSKEYELVTLSRWYKNNQEERLKNADILKYFSFVYGIENAGLKPSKSTFAIASANYNIDECLVVGDSLEYDYYIPREIGMNSVFLNKENIDTNADYINNLNELYNYLERGKKL